MSRTILGHILSIFTVVVWGATFISTKVLLEGFNPLEILLCRFIMGYIALFCMCPRFMKDTNKKQELTLVAASFCGIFVYYLFENMAISYTFASNVGIISSAIAPFSTVIMAHLFLGSGERMRPQFFVGFVFALVGIAFISLNGMELHLNPLGDMLAIISASVWGIYSVLMKKISAWGQPVILVTRRIFFYGMLFMLPMLFVFDCRLEFSRLLNYTYLLNMCFLGIVASAVCFVSWNYAVGAIGAVKTSFYIYAMPVITIAISAVILHEPLTLKEGIGTVLTILGLVISEYRTGKEH